MSIQDDIRSRGHVVVAIRPTNFDPQLVPSTELEPILRRSAVQLRGWDMPHLDPHSPIKRKADHIEQESSWRSHLEHWAFYQSGQFADISSLRHDWLDRYDTQLIPKGWQSGKTLPVADTIFTITEVFELAARLAFTPAGGEQMHVFISYRGLESRILEVDDNRRAPFFREYRYDDDQIDLSAVVPREQLASEAWDLAATYARDLFMAFDWQPAVEVIKGAQGELRGQARRGEDGGTVQP